MKNKNLIIMVAVVTLVAGVSFFGGLQYQKGQAQAVERGQTDTSRGEGAGHGGENDNFRADGRSGNGMVPIRGEIMSADDTSITIKMEDGSSRIVILSGDTKINKTSEASKADLKAGDTVTAFGTQNADGSITAQNISLGGGTMMFRGRPGQ